MKFYDLKINFYLKISIYAVISLFFASCESYQSVEKIPLESFFNNAQKSHFHISPDGKNVSYLQSFNGKLNLFVQSLENDSVKRITSFSDFSIKQYGWAGDHHLMYLKLNETGGNCFLNIAKSDGSTTLNIPLKTNTKIKFLKNLQINDHYALITTNERMSECFDVYRIDLNTGEKLMIEENPGYVTRWLANGNGEIKLALGSDGINETIYYKMDKEFLPVKSCNFVNRIEPIGFSAKKDHIYALSNMNRDKLSIVEFNCATGKEAAVIYENDKVDVVDFYYSKKKSTVLFAMYEDPKPKFHFLDNGLENLYDHLKDKIGENEIKLIDTDDNEENLIIRTYTDKDPGSYYLYRVKDQFLLKLDDVNKAIDPSKMCNVEPITYKSRDGLEIEGFLTLPKGIQNKNLPVVVYPHHGPFKKNSWIYSSDVQFLANRGYAVFQMNYRGSSGYGKKFKVAGYKEWNGKIQDDITDGVHWLIENKIADPNRIAIFGEYFGGFTALNQAINNPNLYACAISYSGYLNLFTYIKGYPEYFKPMQKMIDVVVGNPEKDMSYLRNASPIFHTNKVKIPLFLTQNTKDPRVNLSEFNQFVKEIRKNKGEINYLINENNAKDIDQQNNNLVFYKNMESFLSKNLISTR
jgi:dipeptidyl aminopeptidase/acylaminoacyl peptidase